MQVMAPRRKPKDGKEGSNAESAPERLSYSACYDLFLPEATKLEATEVELCRADVRIAFANVKCGVNAVCADTARIRKALPQIPLDDVLSLPDLCRGLIFATTRITGRPASLKEVEEHLAVIREPREQMLKVAETLAAKKLLPIDEVTAIRAGSGKFDMASDGIALVRIYKDYAAAVRGKHPFTDEEFETLRIASEWLLDHLTPDGARRSMDSIRGEAADVRDRLWTLTLQRHSDLRAIGYYFHRDQFEEITPRLQSRVGAAVAIEEDEEVAVGDAAAGDEGPSESPPA